MAPCPPRNRDDFEIALICALPLEAGLIQMVFDTIWEQEDRQYSRVPGDQNEYTTGVIGEYNVVLAYMPGMGKIHAASVATSLQISFPAIKLTIVAGICGGAPEDLNGNEIVLGDVIISQRLVQYDFGRQYPNEFERKATVEDTLYRAAPAFRSILAKAQTPYGRHVMQQQMALLLESVTRKMPESRYPGADADKLYESHYLHKHHGITEQDCACGNSDGICESAHQRTCDDLHCDQDMLLKRSRLAAAEQAAREASTNWPRVTPVVHYGTIGSADTVVKSAVHRDNLAKKDKLIAFEMEGIGVCKYLPSIVVKAVCDYADSHKNKDWQMYAAAASACCVKALLKLRTPEDKGSSPVSETLWHVPFDQLPSIIGRDREVCELRHKLFQAGQQRAAVYGLGGVGKSRIAWEMANHARGLSEPYSVFWVQSSSVASFEKDFLEIGRALNITGFDDERTGRKQLREPSNPESDGGNLDRKLLVKQYLENTYIGKYLLILDSADDETLWGSSGEHKQHSEERRLLDYIPKNAARSLLITTRSPRVAAHLVKSDMIQLRALEPAEAVKALHSLMPNNAIDTQSQASLDLVQQLSCLPLAIVQATAFMTMNGVDIPSYLDLLQNAQGEEEIIKLLSEDFEDESRYKDTQNAVASTWLLSFKQLQLNHAGALDYLAFMSCLDEKNIPNYLLPELVSKAESVRSIGILHGYSFIQTQTQSGASQQTSLYSLHRLVRLAMRNWLRQQKSLVVWTEMATVRVLNILQTLGYQDKNSWMSCFPHAQTLCAAPDEANCDAKYYLMMEVARFLWQRWLHRDAISYQSRVISWCERMLGPHHLTTLQAYLDISETLCDLGDLSEAEKYATHSFSSSREVFGAENPHTLRSMRVLAVIYRYREQYKKAEDIQLEALRRYKTHLGVKHPDVLGSMSELAYIYYLQRETKKARELSTETLQLCKEQLGIEHYKTLAAMVTLSFVYRDRFQFRSAEVLQVQVLEIRRRLLGDEHPETLMAMQNLAITYKSLRQHEKAAEFLLEVLKIRKKLLGVGHPDTLDNMMELAHVWYISGRHGEAVTLMAACAEQSRSTLGAEHHVTKLRLRDWRLMAAFRLVMPLAFWTRRRH